MKLKAVRPTNQQKGFGMYKCINCLRTVDFDGFDSTDDCDHVYVSSTTMVLCDCGMLHERHEKKGEDVIYEYRKPTKSDLNLIGTATDLYELAPEGEFENEIES